MSGKKNELFRKSLGGYNREDVNSYIASISNELKSKEDFFEMQKERMLREMEAEKEQKSIASAQLDELAFELYSANDSLKLVSEQLQISKASEEELKSSVECLSEKIAELEAKLAEKEAESKRNAEILEKIGVLVGIENVGADGEDSLYDEVVDRLGEVVFSAKADAEKIVLEAENEAEELREKYKNAAGKYYEEVLLFISDIQDFIEGFVREIGARSTALENRIDFLRLPEPESELENELPEIGGECREKTVIHAGAKRVAEPKKKTSAMSFDEKLESFFKNTMAAINAFKGKS